VTTNVTHFLYEAKVNNITVIKSMFRCFELVVGLRLNFHKSKIGRVAIDNDILQNYDAVLNCSHMSISSKYLGMLIGGNPIKNSFG